MNSVEVVYNNRDNTIDLELQDGGVSLSDYSSISRVVLVLDGVTSIDSNVNSSYFDWTGNKIILKLGLAGVVTGKYYNTRLVTYDPSNQNGIVWTDNLRLWVK